jgi:uncharacterized protein YacL
MHFVRILYVLLVLGSGAVLLFLQPFPHGIVLLVAGLLVLVASFLLEMRLRRSSLAARQTLAGGAGLLLGLLIGMATLAAIDELPLIALFKQNQAYVASAVWLLFLCMLGYVGLVAGQVVARDVASRPASDEELAPRTRFLLGEKALVDGRVVRLAQSPLLAGEIVVPRYVVDALQSMAASKSSLEHFRGERGLDNLRALQQIPNRPVRIREIDIARGEVEGLMEFAKRHDTRLLSQNAELLAEAASRGIPTVDLNGLADLLKPEIVQGSELVVKLVKPGKERDQAVGYLEDGNMVVVENGRDDLGRTVRIVVTGIHQTRAGTLIFGTRREGSAEGRARPEAPPPTRPTSAPVPGPRPGLAAGTGDGYPDRAADPTFEGHDDVRPEREGQLPLGRPAGPPNVPPVDGETASEVPESPR